MEKFNFSIRIFPYLMANIYDKAMHNAEVRCLQEWRAELLNSTSGTVLEIGAGSGLNLAFYPNTVSELYLLEPDKTMRIKLEEKILSDHGHNKNIKVIATTAESIPLPDNSCDHIVSTLVLCSVLDIEKVLSEVKRILKPQGKFIFIEHVAANNRLARLKWQHRLEPIWKIIACGCHLTRETEKTIQNAGFKFIEISHQSIRGVPAIVRPSIKGIAIKEVQEPEQLTELMQEMSNIKI